jgi:D-alanyl-D-alanine carboxypeptidase/D-alanyl-D-alanine-endopeptidase (penicillin-binding protein 4)
VNFSCPLCYSDEALFSGAAETCRDALNQHPLMNILLKRANWLFIAFYALFSTIVHAQADRPPLMQDLTVQRPAGANPSATPKVQKTGSSTPAIVTSAPPTNAVRTLFPALAEVPIPGYSGVLIESLDGNVVVESNAATAFNPASNVKVATAYAVLKSFGPEFRFLTNVYTDGVIDRSTGTLTGNVYLSGRDPMFGYQHAVTIANELNKLGIRSVTGDLIVTDNFTMNYSGSTGTSANSLFATIDASKRSPAATRAWLNYLSHSGQFGKVNGVPGITFTGGVYVQPIPSNLQHLFTHESAPMRDILKATLCYSNNFLSERLGDMLGGPYSVAQLVRLNANISPAEFSLQTSSGLGYNRVTPNAMMKLLRALRSDLARYEMTFADIMPVAGVDEGTLEARFDADFSRGSVVGKTGTLGNTDGGVSALAGEVNTRNGRLLFVIFNQRGSVTRFRAFQNYYVSLVQGQFGGAQSMGYDAVPLDTRLARTRVSYPTGRGNGEE